MRSNFFRGSYLAVGVAVLLSMASAAVWAQETTGSITGVVEDESGGALPAVSITVANEANAQARTVLSNRLGRYSAPGLQPGQYSVTAELSSFATLIVSGITVNVGSAVDMDIAMQLASVTETVTVTGETPLIESTKTELKWVISREAINNLPSRNQQYLDFALLTPGVSLNVTRVQGNGVIIAGARSKEGTLLVDGFYNLDEGFTMVKQQHSQDTIQEFQVVSFGGAAEYGRAIGGVINAVTKSGTNRFAGTGYGFFRQTDLNAQEFGEKARGLPKSDFDRKQWGGSFGGPVQQGKSFFFVAAERLDETRAFDNRIKASDGAAIGLPPEDVGSVPSFIDKNYIFGKFDHNINENQRLQASFSYTNLKDHNVTWQFNRGARSVAQQLPFIDYAYTVNWTNVAREGASLHEFKVSYFPRDYHSNGLQLGGPPLVPEGILNVGDQKPDSPPSVTISSVANFGGVWLNNHIKTYPVQAIYTSSMFTDQHTVKFGADYMYAYYDYNQFSPLRGRYSFRSLEKFLAGEYNTYTQGFGATSSPRTHQYISAFLQDAWVVNDRLTMNYGLRYDLEIQPSQTGSGIPFGNDYNNFGPRFALSYDVSGEGRTFLKATTGVFYDRIWNNTTNDLYNLKDNEIRVNATWRPGDPGAPTYPNTFTTPPAVIPSSVHDVVIMPDDVNIPMSAQATVSIEHSLSSVYAIKASAIYSRSWHKEYRWDTNLEFDEATGSYFRPDTNFRRIRQFRFDAPAEYTGGFVELSRRGARVGFTGSVTVARAFETAGVFSSPNDQRAGIEADWGPQPDTPTVAGVVSGWYSFKDNVQVSGIYRAQTGYPVDPRASGFDLNGDGAFSDRTPGLDPFSFNGPGTNALDARLTWTIPFQDNRKLQLFLEGFNILNHENVRTVDRNYGPNASQPGPNWMSITSWFQPREIQLGVKLAF